MAFSFSTVSHAIWHKGKVDQFLLKTLLMGFTSQFIPVYNAAGEDSAASEALLSALAALASAAFLVSLSMKALNCLSRDRAADSQSPIITNKIMAK